MRAAALELAQTSGMPELMAWSRVLEGIHQLELGAAAAAATLLIDGVHTGATVGAYEVVLRGAIALAGIALEQGQLERSARWCVLASALEAQWSWPLTIREAYHRGELARIQCRLGPDRIAAVADDYSAGWEAMNAALQSLLTETARTDRSAEPSWHRFHRHGETGETASPCGTDRRERNAPAA